MEHESRRFKKMRSVHMPYNIQGYIYFVCMNYKIFLPKMNGKINEICKKVCGEIRGGECYCQALEKVMTTDRPVEVVADEYYMSSHVLYKLRRRFYETFYEEMKGK